MKSISDRNKRENVRSNPPFCGESHWDTIQSRMGVRRTHTQPLRHRYDIVSPGAVYMRMFCYILFIQNKSMPSEKTLKLSLWTHDPRSLATTLYREGAQNCPPVAIFSISGKVSSSGFGRNSNFWTIDVKNKNNSIFANCSPRQYLGPTEKGITCFDLIKFPSLSKCLSGLNFFGSSQSLGSLWTAHKFGTIYCTKMNLEDIGVISDTRKLQFQPNWNTVQVSRNWAFQFSLHISRKAVYLVCTDFHRHFRNIPIFRIITTAHFFQRIRSGQLNAAMTLHLAKHGWDGFTWNKLNHQESISENIL